MLPFSEIFFSAVCTLAGRGSLKDRLISAYTEYLEPLPKGELPENIRHQFESLWRMMHSAKPSSTESPVIASVRKMSTTEANRCASRIVAMCGELVRDKTTGEPLRLLDELDSEKSAELEQSRASTLN